MPKIKSHSISPQQTHAVRIMKTHKNDITKQNKSEDIQTHTQDTCNTFKKIRQQHKPLRAELYRTTAHVAMVKELHNRAMLLCVGGDK